MLGQSVAFPDPGEVALSRRPPIGPSSTSPELYALGVPPYRACGSFCGGRATTVGALVGVAGPWPVGWEAWGRRGHGGVLKESTTFLNRHLNKDSTLF